MIRFFILVLYVLTISTAARGQTTEVALVA